MKSRSHLEKKKRPFFFNEVNENVPFWQKIILFLVFLADDITENN